MLIAFSGFDREPPKRDEDSWTLRPLVRSLGRHRVEVRVSADGFVDRLRLAAPGQRKRMPEQVAVELALSRFGEEAGVSHMQATAIE